MIEILCFLIAFGVLALIVRLFGKKPDDEEI